MFVGVSKILLFPTVFSLLAVSLVSDLITAFTILVRPSYRLVCDEMLQNGHKLDLITRKSGAVVYPLAFVQLIELDRGRKGKKIHLIRQIEYPHIEFIHFQSGQELLVRRLFATENRFKLLTKYREGARPLRPAVERKLNLIEPPQRRTTRCGHAKLPFGAGRFVYCVCKSCWF